MELLERESYLDQLTALFQSAKQGKGHSVFVLGEAGIGKTSLVKEFLSRTGDSALILTGSCDSLFTPRPLGPLYDIAPQMGGSFFEILKTEKDRSLIFATFLHELMTGKIPVVLVFEDIHWVDEATMDFIKFLARRIGRLKCLFVLTYRDDEMKYQYPLTSIFGELPSDGYSKIAVNRLSREAVNQLALGKGYGSGDDVYKLTSGNPFYVTEILANYSPGIPERVKDSILAVFKGLGESARELWEFLSILPTGIDAGLFAQMDPSFGATLANCIASNIIVSPQDHLSFKHEIYRITIEESMTPYRRKALHRRVLALMQNLPSDTCTLSQLIHHARLADDHQLIAKFAPRAAREAASLGAHIEASKLYLVAIKHIDKEDPSLASLYEQHAYECYLTNQSKEAIDSQERALQLWRKDNVRQKEGDTLRLLSQFWWHIGDQKKAIALARESIQVLESETLSRECALAYCNFAQLSMLADDLESALAWGQKASTLAAELDDLRIVCYALNSIGSAMLRIPSTEQEGAERLNQSLSIALANGFHEHVARAYANLSYSYVLTRRYQDAEEVFETGLKYCDDNDLYSWKCYLLICKVKTLFETGRWAEAESLATATQNSPNNRSRITALTILAKLAIRLGRLDQGMEIIVLVKSLAMATCDPQLIAPVLTAELERCWITGEPFLWTEMESEEFKRCFENHNVWITSHLAYWIHKAGLHTHFIAGREIVTPFELELKGKFRAAAERWKEIRCPYEFALALSGGNEENQLEAIQRLTDMGANATRDMLKSKLRRKGVKNIPRGPRESTRNNPAMLTKRQIEILSLLGQGSQNKEIADKLFISQKTVEHHISSILSKLEVSSRSKAVFQANKLGIIK